jgi:2,3-bisphosphoglycerate-independent phosphoglycerate mutase
LRIEPVQKAAAYIRHSPLHLSFFVGRSHIAGPGFKAVVGGEVQITGMIAYRAAFGVFEYGGFKVVDHHFFRNAVEESESVFMTAEEMRFFSDVRFLEGFSRG